MRNNAPLGAAAGQPPGLALQPLDGVERAAGLEGADLLEVLALEPQPELRPGLAGGSGSGGECRQRGARDHRGPVHKRLDELPRLGHRGPRQRRRCGRVGHGRFRIDSTMATRRREESCQVEWLSGSSGTMDGQVSK